MFVIQAPYPKMQRSLVLPSPRKGNTLSPKGEVQTLRAMDGTLYTYIRSKRNRKGMRWGFLVSSDKADEVREFIAGFATGLVQVRDHLDVIHIGYITINPLELTGDGKALGWPGGEAYQFSIELETQV